MKKLSIVAVSISILAACRTIAATILSDGIISLLVAIVTLSLSAYFYSLFNESLEEVEVMHTQIEPSAPLIKKQTEEEILELQKQRELEEVRRKELEEKRKAEEKKRKEEEEKRRIAEAKRKAEERARIREVENRMHREFKDFCGDTLVESKKHHYQVATARFAVN